MVTLPKFSVLMWVIFLLICIILESLNQDPQCSPLWSLFWWSYVRPWNSSGNSKWFSYSYWCDCSGENSFLILFVFWSIDIQYSWGKISYINFTDTFVAIYAAIEMLRYYWCSNCYKLCMSSSSHQVDIGFWFVLFLTCDLIYFYWHHILIFSLWNIHFWFNFKPHLCCIFHIGWMFLIKKKKKKEHIYLIVFLYGAISLVPLLCWYSAYDSCPCVLLTS